MSAPYIDALANREFVKMNGLGNEIVIVDLRHAPKPVAAAAVRAAARQEPYDQLMALYPARGAADAAVRIYNNDGSEAGACGNGMRCVAALLAVETGHADLRFETPAGVISCRRAAGDLFTPSIWAARAGAGMRFHWRTNSPIRGQSNLTTAPKARRCCARRQL